MKILLDTSYFLPLIGFTISNVEKDFLLHLIDHKKNFEIYYSTISIFELQAKGGKEIEKGNVDMQQIIRGIQSLNNEKALIEIPFTNSTLITQLSVELRKQHSDFIDCLILSTALLNTDMLVSEDKWIKEFILTADFQELISYHELSSEFRVVTSKDFWKEIA